MSDVPINYYDPAKHLEVLKDLTFQQRITIRWAFKRWVEVARAENYGPMDGWGNFDVEVDHSALLSRLLSGKDAVSERPKLEHSYPVYPD